MQKGDSAKLKLLLAGISARLTKNRDFFVQADCTLVSGKKKFDAKLSRADEDYTLHFQGSDRRVDAAEFCAFFAEQAEKYDESVLTYTERSTVVTLSVTARGVQISRPSAKRPPRKRRLPPIRCSTAAGSTSSASIRRRRCCARSAS